MLTIKALRDQRVALATEARNYLDTNTGDGWNAEASKAVEEIYAKIDRIDEQIAAIERQARIDGDAASAAESGEASAAARANMDPTERERHDAYAKVFRSFLLGGVSSLSHEEIKLLRSGAVQNAQSGQQGNGSAGGYLVPTGFGGELIEALKAFGGMRKVANVIKTSMGNPIPWPTVDETSQTGELVAESSAAGTQDITFGTIQIGAYKFSSKVFTVPIELLMDEGPGIDIEAYIRRAAATRIARSQNAYFTTGSGTSQPRGVVTAAASGVAMATGNTTTVGFSNLIDLIHSVDPAYRVGQLDGDAGDVPSVGFMFHDTTLRTLKKLQDSQGRPLWLPSVAQGEPDRFLDYGYTINQDMATMAASAKSILFGDFGQYLIRDIMEVTLFRFDDSAFMTKGQIGFLAWARADGNLMTAGQPVKYLQQSAT